MGITGSNRGSILYLLHLRLLYYSVLFLFIRYWFTLMYQYTVYTVIILGLSNSPYLLFSIFNLGLLYYTNVIWSYIFLLGCSSRPRFYNKSIIPYGSILYFWFSLPTQYCNALNSIFGLLYYPYYIFDLILFLVYYTGPMFHDLLL